MKFLILLLSGFLVFGLSSCIKKCTNPEILTFTPDEEKMIYYHKGDSLMMMSNLNDTLELYFYEEETDTGSNEENCISSQTKTVSFNISTPEMKDIGSGWMQIGHNISNPKNLYFFLFRYTFSFTYNGKYLEFQNYSNVNFYDQLMIDSINFTNIYKFSGKNNYVYFSSDYGFIKFIYTDDTDTLSFRSVQYW